jgi:hypothetical protein
VKSDLPIHLSQQVRYTLVSGAAACGTERVGRSGVMVRSMKEIGSTTRRTATASSSTRTGKYMRENGQMTRPMGMEPTPTQTIRSTQESGRMTCRTEKVRKLGPMRARMRDTTGWGRSMGMESTNGQMAASTRGCGAKTKFLAAESIPGLTGAVTKASGTTT